MLRWFERFVPYSRKQINKKIETLEKEQGILANDFEISIKEHVNQAISNSEISTKEHVNQAISNSEISIKEHVNQAISNSEISIKEHVNQAISNSEISTKEHVNIIVSDLGRQLQTTISDYAIQCEFNLRSQIEKNAEFSKFIIGQHILKIRDNTKILSIRDAELSIFSQWGEDGIIQWIINKLSLEDDFFIEFGVEDYKEANTRFLLMNNNWSGLIIDSSQDAIDKIKKNQIYWKYDITAKCNFITRENINDIFEFSDVPKEIGLLSIDIDGNDYWVWEAITKISPKIVICEYNSIFGCDYEITIPYKPEFDRTKAHFSNLYWGASLPALCLLAHKKGYVFIGSNSAGNNAFFIRKDLSLGFEELSAKEGYVNSKYRESRDEDGRLNYISGKKRLLQLKDLPVYDLTNDIIRPISWFDLGNI